VRAAAKAWGVLDLAQINKPRKRIHQYPNKRSSDVEAIKNTIAEAAIKAVKKAIKSKRKAAV
jgi:hypothetical protein